MHLQNYFYNLLCEQIGWLKDITDKQARYPGDRKIEMTHTELEILCNIIKNKNPEKILEVGVAAGGTTAVILKTLEILGMDAVCHSVDLNKRYYGNKEKETGYMVKQSIPELKNEWILYTGKVIPEYLPIIGKGIDLCILDTMHTVPGELLDFITILPYLSENAIVVLHDTSLHILRHPVAHATGMLFALITGEKYTYSDENNFYHIANISSVKITKDTIKYVENIFYGLMMPWAYFPKENILHSYDTFILNHYSASLYAIFRKASLIYNEKLNRKK